MAGAFLCWTYYEFNPSRTAEFACPGRMWACHRVMSRGCTATGLNQEAKIIISIGCSLVSSLQPQTEELCEAAGQGRKLDILRWV